MSKDNENKTTVTSFLRRMLYLFKDMFSIFPKSLYTYLMGLIFGLLALDAAPIGRIVLIGIGLAISLFNIEHRY